jgi:hypothetical protein
MGETYEVFDRADAITGLAEGVNPWPNAEPIAPAAADPRQLNLLNLLQPKAEAQPVEQVPTDPVTGLPLFLKRTQATTAEAAQ